MKHTKTTIITLAALLLTISISAQQPPVKTAKPPVPVKLTNAADSSQYILGAYLGQYLNTNGFVITNAELFIKGMDDVLTKKPLMVNADTIPKMMNEYLTRLVVDRNRTLEKQLFDNVKGKPGVGTLPSGVCYAIVKAGTGLLPMLNDSISIHVKGYLPDGRLFEDTYAKNTPLKTTPARMITGMKETLQIMPAGSLWRLYIPSALAYGSQGVGAVIPPYSAVVFDVELLNIIK